jgi:hypothetical protein
MSSTRLGVGFSGGLEIVGFIGVLFCLGLIELLDSIAVGKERFSLWLNLELNVLFCLNLKLGVLGIQGNWEFDWFFFSLCDFVDIGVFGGFKVLALVEFEAWG